jgi:hypothetical protein
MELTELNRRQQIALVALIEELILSDGTVGESEQSEIGQLAETLGEEHYRELLDEADEQIPDTAALKKLLCTITGQEARNLIYGTAMEEAMLGPSVKHEQAEFLAWLKQTWNIEIEES